MRSHDPRQDRQSVVMAEETVGEQAGFRVRFGWGPNDTSLLAPRSDLVVVVDVLRFTTAVTVGVERGALVYPYRWHDDTARAFAATVGAVLGAAPMGRAGRCRRCPCRR